MVKKDESLINIREAHVPFVLWFMTVELIVNVDVFVLVVFLFF